MATLAQGSPTLMESCASCGIAWAPLQVCSLQPAAFCFLDHVTPGNPLPAHPPHVRGAPDRDVRVQNKERPPEEHCPECRA